MVLRPLTLVGIILSIVSGLALGVGAHLYTRAKTPADPSRTLSQALRQVSESYVTEVSEEELLGFAIEGMMNGLDEHSDYLDAGSFESLQSTTSGRFGGIGIELGLVDGYFTVVAPMDGTPAAAAGLEPGDRITAVDDDPIKGMKLSRLIKILRGEPGSPVTLSIFREEEDAFDVTLERAIIRVASVKSRLLEPGYGYLRISQFQTHTSRDVVAAIEALVEEDGDQLKGLVLDLRNNPGGTLQSSVEVADHFLDDGLIVYTEGRLQSSYAKYRATKGDVLQGVPMVVLINGGSASASEIVAAALRDHERATLIGSKSYGKGSVQSVLPLDDEQALKLTTAYYFTPAGTSIHKKGIEPDMPLSLDDELLIDEAVQHLKAETQAQHVYLSPPPE
ncbi:MAG: PDZ domain-containing protein [Pseudomonadales bacterium]|nr:PDZ domain-containing protein [Pseudomonadales bacterium]